MLRVETSFCELAQSVSEIVHFEWGTNCSPEKLSAGFTHVFFLTFASGAARDTYLSHPKHLAFVQLLKQSGVCAPPDPTA